MWSSDVNDAVVKALSPTANEHVADIGAGVGAAASQTAHRAGRVFAIEPTPYMRRILSARARMSRRPYIVVDGSAEDTGLSDDSVHVIMAVNSMHHWTDMDAAIIELGRILRPNGRMLLVDENFEDPSHPDHKRWTAMHDESGHSHRFHMVDTDAIAAKLEAAGMPVRFHGEQAVAGRPAWMIDVRQ